VTPTTSHPHRPSHPEEDERHPRCRVEQDVEQSLHRPPYYRAPETRIPTASLCLAVFRGGEHPSPPLLRPRRSAAAPRLPSALRLRLEENSPKSTAQPRHLAATLRQIRAVATHTFEGLPTTHAGAQRRKRQRPKRRPGFPSPSHSGRATEAAAPKAPPPPALSLSKRPGLSLSKGIFRP
jgi:hypothetical protein